MHPPDELQLKTYHYGLSHFYVKSSKFTMHNLKYVATDTWFVKILQYSSGVNG